MSDEPSLPRLPAISWDERSQSFSNNPRKRVRKQELPSLRHDSSDPAVFSSDDDPGLDNYVEGRRKKRYVGSWFQQLPKSSDSTFSEGPSTAASKPKRTLQRQFDSGVYLGSDGTESEDAIDNLDMPMRPKLPQLDKRPVIQISKQELAAQDKIQTYLDQGCESIDLWSLGLEEISNNTISRLSQFSCIPTVTKDVAFEQKEPELKIFLAMNSLTRLPGALFDLTYLTVLSLRGNRLTEIPPSISQLRNLKQLNLSQNRLRHLPAELLDLLKPDGRLRDLVIHPNQSFFQPEGSLGALRELGDHEEGFTKLTAVYYHQKDDSYPDVRVPPFVSRSLGRSLLQISNSSGSVISEFKLPVAESSNEVALAPRADNASDDAPSSQVSSAAKSVKHRPSKVPSLVEVALQSCQRTSQLRELEYYIPEGLEHLRRLLRRAAVQKDAGGLVCSKCRKLVVVPVMEWIEWREIKTCSMMVDTEMWQVTLKPFSNDEAEAAVPFLYRACSWQCGPGNAAVDMKWQVPEYLEPVFREAKE